MRRSPSGVAYLVCFVSAQPGRYSACDGPKRKIRLALERSRDLYAHAAAGPEYEYPACLRQRQGSKKHGTQLKEAYLRRNDDSCAFDWQS